MNIDCAIGFCAWRKLGDVIASIYALGYHENIETKSNAPPFLTDLRKTVFARAFSGDKNIAIFLGRPPRMSKRFAYFQTPLARVNPESGEFLPDSDVTAQPWDPDSTMSYRAETRWSALCAFVKEDILELLYSGHRNNSAKIRYGTKALVFTRSSQSAVKFLGKPMRNGKRCLLVFDSRAI
jgi:hypothetical protein